MDKKERADIYQETVHIVKNGEYASPNGTRVTVNDLNDVMISKTKFYSKKLNINYNSLPKYNTEVKVVNNDCLYEAKKLIDDGFSPAVLNMASFSTPGGGVINGASAQEENIFRRTNLFLSLYQFSSIGLNYGIKQKEERYPLHFRYGGIYTPKVAVFRGGEDVNYELLDDLFYVDIITLSALKNPTTENGKIIPSAESIIKCKIRQILDIAIENGNDSLVLSAFGCGAYKTPPEQMAMFFADVLASEDYQGVFKVIHFAIIDDPSKNREHNPNGNLKPFQEIFS